MSLAGVHRPSASLQAEVAESMFQSIPERARAMILGGAFRDHGLELVKLSSEIHRPSFRDRVV